MSQERQKQAAAEAAVDYVAAHLEAGAALGVGTGSTVNFFIDALSPLKEQLGGAIASSEATRQRLAKLGIPLLDLNDIDRLAIYVDGADEIDHDFAMIKGGGGALTREKIIAAAADVFVCIADAGKRVDRLGNFPLPVEVIPLAKRLVAGQLTALGGRPLLREGFVTDNGNLILDVAGLSIHDPQALEATINQITGVVCNGLFAARGADILLLGTENGVLTCAPPAATLRR
ncbi:MAG: ribose-5-phosphate isomerase RpiA [Betaproteobacteria bacterium]|nr:ribose-5-phosphate isomerase RpiA [Betaproteobacteria bacterium]